MTRTDATVIQTFALTKVYPGGIVAVEALDLAVSQGEIFGLLGPNGAGKTTTVGMLTTRVVPTSGRAVVGGVDVVDDPTSAKQMIGVVSQQNTLDRSVSVWENLYFHGRYFAMSARQARSAADDALDMFRLAERRDSNVATLSGGMAQRLMVARAIIHHPALLFLDEPTAGLDPQSRLALWDILRDLNREGQTILITTHYMEEADRLCDRVAVMDRGHLMACDTPVSLKRSIDADTIVKVSIEGDISALARHLESFEGVKAVNITEDAAVVHMTGANGVLPRIVAHADSGGFRVTDLSIAEPTLETVFINLTGRDLRE